MNTNPSTRLNALKSLAALLPGLAIVSCTVGPNYQKPEVAAVKEFRSQPGPQDANSLADLPWWQVFNDKALQSLISEALKNNYDLRVATARIEQARALVGVARSEALPHVGYQGFIAGEQAFVAQEHGAGTLTYGTIGGLLNAAWELDIWGRIRRSTEAARANLFAQEDVRRGVMLTLVSDIAANYFQLLELDRELSIAEDSAGSFKKTLDLFTARFEAGRDSKLGVVRAQAAYQSSIDSVANLKRAIAQQENVISVLVGAYPRGIDRGLPLTDQATPPTPVGLTTDLLKRRPDILQAEQNMIGANAEIGVAVANYYPRVGLSALVGVQGVNNGANIHNAFSLWNLAGGISGPIFEGGRLKSIYNQRQAFWDETVAQYKKTVQVAFRETSDALVAQQTLVDRRAALESQVRASQEAVDLALLRYNAGRANYLEVLEAQLALYPAESSLAQTRRDQLLAAVSLYKALGGGWKLQDAEWAGPH